MTIHDLGSSQRAARAALFTSEADQVSPSRGRHTASDNRNDDGQINDDLERRCAKLLAQLQKLCPGLLPTGPVPAGEVLDPIEVRNDDLHELILAAVGVTDRRRRNQVVWEQAGSELLVHLAETRVRVVKGLVIVGITIETNETGVVEVTVPFAVGRPGRLAGMIVSTEPKPRGPALIIDRWGDALIAAAWQAVLDVIGTLTARAGVDEQGTPLLPGAVVAHDGRLTVVAQAPQVFERSRR
ncbi:MAG: hypothetical protein OES24_23590 [Acidimicrobiia bacterium]|nr:hypothetical protein [Acidimicrobiia bacterium]